jgi:uncharacterized membrane protein YadS
MATATFDGAALTTGSVASTAAAPQMLLPAPMLGVILFGFRITLQQIADVGVSGILIDALTLSSTFFTGDRDF